MPKRRSERAKRRIAQRTIRNALALEAAIDREEERPKLLRKARHVTQLYLSHIRGGIDARQLAAGERLAGDFARAGDMPFITARYEVLLETPTKGAVAFRPEPTQAQIDARRRFERAVLALGPWLTPVLMHTAVLDQPLATWECPAMTNGADRRGVLRLALNVLADHYGLEPEYHTASRAA
jgi:hypothetical protein